MAMSNPDSQEDMQPKGWSRKDRLAKLGFLAVALAVAAFIYTQQRRDPEMRKWGWGRDLQRAIQQAETDDSKVVVAFTRRPMNHEDRKLVTRGLTFYKSRAVLDHLKYPKVHLDNKTHKGLFAEYGVTETPVVMLLDGAGKVLRRYDGFMTDIAFCNDFLKTSHASITGPADRR